MFKTASKLAVGDILIAEMDGDPDPVVAEIGEIKRQGRSLRVHLHIIGTDRDYAGRGSLLGAHFYRSYTLTRVVEVLVEADGNANS